MKDRFRTLEKDVSSLAKTTISYELKLRNIKPRKMTVKEKEFYKIKGKLIEGLVAYWVVNDNSNFYLLDMIKDVIINGKADFGMTAEEIRAFNEDVGCEVLSSYSANCFSLFNDNPEELRIDIAKSLYEIYENIELNLMHSAWFFKEKFYKPQYA